MRLLHTAPMRYLLLLTGCWLATFLITRGVLLVTHLLRDVDLVDRVVELPAPQEDASRTVLRMPRRTLRKESA